MDDQEIKIDVGHEDFRSKSNVSLLSSRSCKDNGFYGRQNLTKLSREELEDRFFNVLENQLTLKKQALSQTDVIKRMSTKVNRLVSERRRFTKGIDGNLSARNLATEDKIEDQCFRILELEKKNKKLHDSLKVIKHQLSNQKPSNNYSWVKSKINSRPQSYSPNKSKINVKPQILSVSYDEDKRKDYSLQDTKSQNIISEHCFDDQHNKQQFDAKEKEYLSTIQKLEECVKKYQEKTFCEDSEINKLKSELCSSVGRISSLEAQKENLEDNLKLVHQQHQLLIDEIDKLTSQLRDERNKTLSLQKYVDEVDNLNMARKELEDKIIDLKKENEVLSSTNYQLASKTFDFHKNCTSQSVIDGLVEEKKKLIDNLEDSVGKITKLESKISSCERDKELLQAKICEIQAELLNQEQKKSCEKCESYRSITVVPSNLSFLNDYEAEGSSDNEKQVELLQKECLELNEELNKTKSLLEIQKQINIDATAQLEQWKKKLKASDQDHVKIIKDLNDVIKNRTNKVLSLEQQIRNLAVDNIKLSRHPEVQNNSRMCERVFEFEISLVDLMSEELTGEYFLTVHFHTSPVHYSSFLKPSKLDPFLKIIYNLQLTDHVEQYLRTDFLRVELHKFVEDSKEKYATIGTSKIALKEVLKYPGTRLHGTCHLISQDAITVGEISYMISLQSGQASAPEMPSSNILKDSEYQTPSESNVQPKPRARRRSKWFSDFKEHENSSAMLPNLSPSLGEALATKDESQELQKNSGISSIMKGHTIRFIIHHVVLAASSFVAKDNSIKSVFVACNFLEKCPSFSWKTPFHTPILVEASMEYNSSQEFQLSNINVCDHFMKVISLQQSGLIAFTLTAKYNSNEGTEKFKELGSGFVDLLEVLKVGDLSQKDVSIYGFENHGKVIGIINVTVEAQKSLKK